jgi:hypothetical protein
VSVTVLQWEWNEPDRGLTVAEDAGEVADALMLAMTGAEAKAAFEAGRASARRQL